MKKKLLFINACARPNSRTWELAQCLLSTMDGDLETVNLYQEKLLPLDSLSLEKRIQAVRAQEFLDDDFRFARQFARADVIVIAAPYWDLLFPAVLRTYLENITVTGLTFRYTEQGYPEGLCAAKQLYYVTTAGGPIGAYDFGFQYVKTLAQQFFGIARVQCFAAEGLDICGADTDAIMESVKNQIRTQRFPAGEAGT